MPPASGRSDTRSGDNKPVNGYSTPSLINDLQALSHNRIKLNQKHIILRERRVALFIHFDKYTTLVEEHLASCDDRDDDLPPFPSREHLSQVRENISEAEAKVSNLEQQVYTAEFALASLEEKFYVRASQKYSLRENSQSGLSSPFSIDVGSLSHANGSFETLASPSLGSLDPYEVAFGNEVPYGSPPHRRVLEPDNEDDHALDRSSSLRSLVPTELAYLDPVYASRGGSPIQDESSLLQDLERLLLVTYDSEGRSVSPKVGVEGPIQNSPLLSHLLLSFRSPLDRLNRWLLHELRSSKAHISMLARCIEDCFSEAGKSPPTELAPQVLDWWLKDDTHFTSLSVEQSRSVDMASVIFTRAADSGESSAEFPKPQGAPPQAQPNQVPSQALSLEQEGGERDSLLNGVKVFTSEFVPKSNPEEFFVVGRVFQIGLSNLEKMLSRGPILRTPSFSKSPAILGRKPELNLVVIHQDSYLACSICCPMLAVDATEPIDSVLALRKFPKVSVVNTRYQNRLYESGSSRRPANTTIEIRVEVSDFDHGFDRDIRYIPSIQFDVRHEWPVRDVGTIVGSDVHNLVLMAERAKKIGSVPHTLEHAALSPSNFADSWESLKAGREEGSDDVVSSPDSCSTEHLGSSMSQTSLVTDSSDNSWQIPGYWKRFNQPTFFTVGRVFAMIWHAPSTTINDSGFMRIRNRLNYPSIRRLVVRKLVGNYCWCHPVNVCGDAKLPTFNDSCGYQVLAAPFEPEDNWDTMDDCMKIELATELADARQMWAINFGRMYRIDCARSKVMNIGVVAERWLARFADDEQD